MQEQRPRRVALIGWDAADWHLIHPLLDAGLMPNLQKLVEGGVMGKIATLQPALSPMLWTSIATGKTADHHGVLGFLEPDPMAGTARPVASSSRKVKALWNILHQSGFRSHVLNWFAGHPAEPVNGAFVSNAYAKAGQPFGAPWPMLAGTVHPSELTDALADLRIHLGDLTGDDLLPFIPLLARVDQSKDQRPAQLAGILAETITVHAAASWLMENREWEFLAVYFDAIDRAGHLFMQYHPPRLEAVREAEFEIYRDTINGVYCYLDAMLGRLVQLAGPETAIVLVSDHGFESGRLRPKGPDGEPAKAALLWHRTHGVLCMAGPGIRRDELVYGAGLLDIAPTILNLFGLPAAEDMPGRSLAEAFEALPVIDRIPSWEEAPGECGRAADESEDAWDASEMMAQLAALGYFDAVSDSASDKLRLIRLDRTMNLAKVHMECGHYDEAISLLEYLVREQPKLTAHRMYLAQAYFKAGRLADCRPVVEGVIAEAAGRPLAHLLRGNLALSEGRTEEALACLLQAEEAGEPFPRLCELMGRAFLKLDRWDDAEPQFRKALEFNPDSAEAWAGLARLLAEKGDYTGAAEAALNAIGLRFDLPGSHYILGVSLARLGCNARAMQAFETCRALAPETAAATGWMAEISGREPSAALR